MRRASPRASITPSVAAAPPAEPPLSATPVAATDPAQETPTVPQTGEAKLAALGVTPAESKAGPRLDALLPGASHRQLVVGDTIALCVQRGDKFCFVGSEGFVELATSLRELDLAQTVP